MNNSADQSKLIEEIAKASNILITVNSNPTVDELTGALGLALMLNKNSRRAVAIFSGQVPVMINFLDISKTFDSNTNGLRDFIVTLDAKKADRVITKAENGMVKVYITPSGSSVGSDDLEFSQGDYNVDLVIGVGVLSKDDFDKALSSHGRILHSASVVSISIGDKKSDLGSLNLYDPKASSYAEVIAKLPKGLDDIDRSPENDPSMDEAVATALLTGLISVTERFSNNKTTVDVMSLAAELMKAGGNQQLIVAELAKYSQQEAEKNAAIKQAQEAEVRKSQFSQESEVHNQPSEPKVEHVTELPVATSEAGLNLTKTNIPAQTTSNVIDLKAAHKADVYEPTVSQVLSPIASASPAVPITDVAVKNEEPAVTDIVHKKELVIEPPKKEQIKPDFSNLESIGQQNSSEKLQQTANEVLQKLEQVKNNVIHKQADDEAELQKQIDQAATMKSSPLIELNFEEAPIPTVNKNVKTAETKPNPEIIFGQEIVDNTNQAPKLAWGQKLEQNQVPTPKLPIASNGPTLVKVTGTSADNSKLNPPLAPQQVKTEIVNRVQLPPLPDFSRFGVVPPTPPVPPSFEFSLPPSSDPTQIAVPTPTVNPFNQLAEDLRQSQSTYSSKPIQDSIASPVMQDQIYPIVPTDKAEFIIPE